MKLWERQNIISPLENRYKDSDLKRFVCNDDRILISIKKKKAYKIYSGKKKIFQVLSKQVQEKKYILIQVKLNVPL